MALAERFDDARHVRRRFQPARTSPLARSPSTAGFGSPDRGREEHEQRRPGTRMRRGHPVKGCPMPDRKVSEKTTFRSARENEAPKLTKTVKKRGHPGGGFPRFRAARGRVSARSARGVVVAGCVRSLILRASGHSGDFLPSRAAGCRDKCPYSCTENARKAPVLRAF